MAISDGGGTDDNKLNIFKMGYNGCVFMTSSYQGKTSTDQNPAAFFVTNASISQNYNIPTVQPYQLPGNQSSVNSDQSSVNSEKLYHPIRVSYGTCGYSAEISFELSNGFINKMFTDDLNFFDPFYFIDITMYDGRDIYTLPKCVWQSFSISCQPNSICTSSLSFQSLNGWVENISSSSSTSVPSCTFDTEDFLIPYWETGASGLQSFNIKFDRKITPVYLNNGLVTPTYLRPSFIDVDLSLTFLQGYYPTFSSSDNSTTNLNIKIGSKTVTINYPALINRQYNMSTNSETSSQTYQFKSIPFISTQGLIFKIA